MPRVDADAPAPERGFTMLVLGSDIAGLATALAARGERVALVTPLRLGDDGASAWAQGGIAAALDPADSPARHAEDTLRAGQYLNDRAAVARLAAEAPAAIAWLEAQGVRFDRRGATYALAREAAHGCARVAHVGGDGTGAALMRVLAAATRGAPHVTVLEGWRALALCADARGVHGAVLRSAHGEIRRLHARRTVLATGGCGQLFRCSTNPAGALGEGIALALAVGAAVRDLEFVQFHPTALAVDGAEGAPLPLVTEALRGAGAVLRDGEGRRFMAALDPRAELAPRDVVARAVYAARRATGQVLLDARDAVGAAFPERFPAVYAFCRAQGIDPRFEPIPVTPAAHYHMGGVAVDLDGRSSVHGLWAVGEVACSGVHGANRLASNSLLEGVVYGRALAEAAPSGDADGPAAADAVARPAEATPATLASLRGAMWEGVGVERDRRGLDAAIARLGALVEDPERTPAPLRVALAIAEAAHARRGSIGAHFRTDAPLAAGAR